MLWFISPFHVLMEVNVFHGVDLGENSLVEVNGELRLLNSALESCAATSFSSITSAGNISDQGEVSKK
jgi:hypothetical protein